jgi:hypothetical protein
MDNIDNIMLYYFPHVSTVFLVCIYHSRIIRQIEVLGHIAKDSDTRCVFADC